VFRGSPRGMIRLQ